MVKKGIKKKDSVEMVPRMRKRTAKESAEGAALGTPTTTTTLTY